MLIMILILALFVMVAASPDANNSDNTPTEQFLSITTCNYSHIPINCGTRSTIYIHSVQYGYREGCERICCSYNASDCIVHDNKSKNLHNIQQECSEKRSCNVSLDGKQSFCSTINAVASYIVMQYSCSLSDAITADNKANEANVVFIATALSLTSVLVATVAYLAVRFKRRHRMRTGAFNSPSSSQSCSNTENHLEVMESTEQLLEKGRRQWINCIKMKDATNRRIEAHRLLNMRILPDQSELKLACCEFGRTSKLFLTICDTVSEYIKTQSTEIADVWAAYKSIDYKKNNTDNIVFVVITRNGNVGVNINDYNIYERDINDYNEESRIVLTEVENGLQNDDKFTEEELEALENCISETADELMNKHKNLNIISPSMKKSIAFGTKDAMMHDKLCIALYVHIKGLIPVAEVPFQSDICGYPTDVLEGGFTRFDGGPYDFHQKLKMGLAIHANVKSNKGELLVGTLGGFLDHPLFGICGITCAHVVLSGDEMRKIKNLGCENLLENEILVFQPVDHRALSFGRVVSAIYTEGGNGRTGMEVALFKIFDRHPVDGTFPTSEYYRDIGFDDSNPMVFSTGKVCKRSNIRKRSEVYKYGISTEVTRGSLGLLGSAVRTTEMSGRSEALEYRLHNQIPVLRIDGKSFALPGDSGALVFFDDNVGDSVAIGVVEGGQNNGIVFVTPLYDILSALGCPPIMKSFIPLNSVSTDSEMFMECDD